MKRLTVLSAALLLLTGCAAVAREPDDLTLVRVLGVDGGGPVVLTAAGEKSVQTGVPRGRGEGDDFLQARDRLPWSGTATELSLTGVSYLLVAEDVALRELLLAVLDDPDLGASATVWYGRGETAALLESCEDPVADLDLLALKGVDAPTVAETLAALSTDGRVELPCVKEEDGRLAEWGTMEWRAEK